MTALQDDAQQIKHLKFCSRTKQINANLQSAEVVAPAHVGYYRDTVGMDVTGKDNDSVSKYSFLLIR